MTAPVTATFLFTDLVGSTALASRLGPEATEALRQAHFGILRGATNATGGIEVKSTGDGVMLMFTSPSRALSCAAAIQQGIQRHNQRAEEPLEVRVGLSMGEAVEDDGDYYGDCVVEAARLCDKAVGGQILTTAVLRTIVGRHSTHDFAPVGDLELKGLAESVPAVEVRWVPEATPGAIPMPARLVGAATEGLFGFFGRGDELAVLLDASKRALADARIEVVLLGGEPGIGKTTLAAQACRAAHDEGGIVLFGHSTEGLAVPYHPWIEALSHLVEHAPQELLEAHVATHGAAIGRLVPALGRRVPPATPALDASDSDGERYVLLEAITALLAAASSDAALTIVLDDLQWADSATLQVLRHVLAAPKPPSALIIGTYRDTDLSRDHPLTPVLADLRREPNVARVLLGGLSDTELLALMEGAAGYEMPPDGVGLAHAVHRETDGNPFFAGELLRHLYETGAIAFDEDGQYSLTVDLDDVGLPGSVRDVVARRVDRLGDEVSRILTLASVIGREFDLEVLATIAELDDDTTLDHLEAATNAALVTENGELPGRFRFEHTLIQHTLYQDLSATRRQRLHQRIAQRLEELVGDHAPPASELAHHWLAATRPSDVGKALEYARLAGEAALAALAPDDAIRWYTQALELQERQASDDFGTRCDLLIGLGDAQRLAGKPEHRDTLLDAARLADDLGTTDRLVAAALANTRGTQTYETDDERIGVLMRALETVDRDSAPAARILAALGNETDPRDWEQGRDHGNAAVTIARRLGDERLLVEILTATAIPRGQPDALERRLDECAEAIELADRLGLTQIAFQARYQLQQALMEAGRIEESDLLLDDAAARSEEVGLPWVRWQVAIDRVAQAVRFDDLDRAEALAESALELAQRAGIVEGLGVYGGQLLGIRRYQGREAAVADFFLEAARSNEHIEALRIAAIFLLLSVGETDEARRRFEAERRLDFSYNRHYQWYTIMDTVVDATVLLRDHEAAELLYPRLLPFADRITFVHAVAPQPFARSVAQLETLMGRYGESDAHLNDAATVAERLRSPYWTTCIDLDRADLCLARGADGDAARATDLARNARTAAREAGWAGLERRADEILGEHPDGP